MSTVLGIPLTPSDMANADADQCRREPRSKQSRELDVAIFHSYLNESANLRTPRWFLALFLPWLLRIVKAFIFTARERGMLDSQMFHELLDLAERCFAI